MITGLDPWLNPLKKGGKSIAGKGGNSEIDSFCIRTTKITADLAEKVLTAYLHHQEAVIGREQEIEEESAPETGKGHGKRAGKTKCRDEIIIEILRK